VPFEVLTVLEAYENTFPYIPPGDYSLSASEDQMFTIDPGFLLDNPGYSIEYSPNLVPDAANTLELVSLSLIGLVLVSRRLLARLR